jgi:uncharacterized Zn finger protein (UPF0148 family)
MYDLGSLISSHEHGVIGKRSKTNKIQMAKQGLHISGGIPYGYKRNSDTKKLEIDEEAAKTIQYIFQLHSQGYGSFKIRDILNEEGYKSATGKIFNLPAVKRIIRNPHYKGDTVFNDRKRIKKGGKVTYETVNAIVMKGTHPAIISPEIWDKANSDRMERAEKSRLTREKPVTKSEITMLKDLIYCGVCHKKLIIRKDNKSNTGYTIKRCEYLQANGDKCPNCGIRVEFVEEKVLSRLQEFKKQLQSYIKLIEENGSDQVKQDQQQKINQLQKRLKEVEFEENNLLDLAIKGLFSHDKIRDKQQELINLKTNIETQLESIQNEEVEQVTESTKDKINEILEIIDKLPTLNKEQVNQSLKTFIKKIHYKRVIPEDLLKLSTQNKQRKLYPFELQMEYYQL